MTACDRLAAILAGAGSSSLLNSCRLDRRGEVYGEEAILACFRAVPAQVEGGLRLEAEGSAAIVGTDRAVFADIYSGHVGRIWYVEPSPGPMRVEPAMPVAFDIDLAQARADILFRVDDHPDLCPTAAERLQAAGREVLTHPSSRAAFRARAFAVRAFGDRDRGAALFALHRLGGSEPREAGFAYAVAAWSGDERRTVSA
jgi:hypothetical protein